MKRDELIELAEVNNGYLFTSDVVARGISKTYLASFVKSNSYERVAHGVYISPDKLVDELFVLQKTSPKVVFSGETALYLNGLSDKEYPKIEVTVPNHYNYAHLRTKGISVRVLNEDAYILGRTNIESNYGNILVAYDKERCICDSIRNRDSMDVQVFQTAIKEYMFSRDRNINLLISYANKLGIRDDVMRYIEVMV